MSQNSAFRVAALHLNLVLLIEFGLLVEELNPEDLIDDQDHNKDDDEGAHLHKNL
jgi:hypothetical protein